MAEFSADEIRKMYIFRVDAWRNIIQIVKDKGGDAETAIIDAHAFASAVGDFLASMGIVTPNFVSTQVAKIEEMEQLT
jgi:hypothetical protein